MTPPVSPLLPALALGLLLAGCSPATDEPAATSGPARPPAEKPYVGTIRLLEHRYLLGIRRTDYITLTFDGPRLRREVRPKGFADASERYGVIVDLRTDSVTFYVQDGKRNAHHRLAKADYLASVAANTRILPQLESTPYSSIFEPLPPGAPSLSSAAVAGPALRRLSSFQAVLFMLPDATRCDVFYSEQVRVPKAALAYIEHNAPAALPSLALAVKYTQPAQAKTDGLLDQLQHRLKGVLSHDSEFESLEPTVSADAFDLPTGSSSHLKSSLEPKESSSGSSHHHWHD